MDADGQAGAFFLMVATGAALGFVFDFYRVVRRLLRLRWLATAVADAGFWLLATAAVFTALLVGNWGELRLYVYAGLVAGGGAYFRWLSRLSCGALVWLLRMTARAARVAGRVLAAVVAGPVRAAGRLAAAPLRRLAGLGFWRRSREGGIPPKDNGG